MTNKFFSYVFQISFVLFGLTFICLMGAEPNTLNESSLYEYEHFFDKGHLGWYILWICGISFITTISSYIALKRSEKNINKPTRF